MRTIVITGANTGIGKATAEGLAAGDVRLIFAGRSLERTTPVIEAARARGASTEFVTLDLGDLASVRRAAGELVVLAPRIDVLINNAGVAAVSGQTRDGFEHHVGVNHLGHFAFTMALIDSLVTAKTRVVNVASEAHRGTRALDFASFEKPTRSRLGWPEYCASKLCNILFTKELARRYSGIEAVSLHPGVIASDLWRNIPAPLRGVMKLFMKSNDSGARTSIHCASAASVVNGAYYDKSKERRPNGPARDEALARELWERSEQLVNR